MRKVDDRERNEGGIKKIMSEIVATSVVACRLPKPRLNVMLTARANYKKRKGANQSKIFYLFAPYYTLHYDCNHVFTVFSNILTPCIMIEE